MGVDASTNYVEGKHSMLQPPKSAVDWLSKLVERMRKEIEAGAAQKEEKLTLREFLSKFECFRRGKHKVSMIRRMLDSHNIFTDPDFEYAYIDDDILIKLDDNVAATSANDILNDPTFRISILSASHNSPEKVAPDDPISKATTLMRMGNYSQLPVMTTERDVKGMVNWESIGVVYSDGHTPETVNECMEEDVHEVDINIMIADAAERICHYGYVLVRGTDKKITGIVTAADLAIQFKQSAQPFFLVREIEHHLRNLVRHKFTASELDEASDGNKSVSGPSDLTFGGYCRLLENDERWKKLKLKNIDRKQFTKRLELIRNIRNDVMHFSPDGHAPSEIEELEKMAQFLRKFSRSQRLARRKGV